MLGALSTKRGVAPVSGLVLIDIGTAKARKIDLTRTPKQVGIERRRRHGARQQLRQVQEVGDLPGRGNLRVAGKDAVEQSRPRTRQSDHENRVFGVAAPAFAQRRSLRRARKFHLKDGSVWMQLAPVLLRARKPLERLLRVAKVLIGSREGMADVQRAPAVVRQSKLPLELINAIVGDRLSLKLDQGLPCSVIQRLRLDRGAIAGDRFVEATEIFLCLAELMQVVRIAGLNLAKPSPLRQRGCVVAANAIGHRRPEQSARIIGALLRHPRRERAHLGEAADKLFEVRLYAHKCRPALTSWSERPS